ncbi:MAG: hypothetical protein GOMPHAMPRED_000181 [Gomphillus americanus]|uniref:Uncharacterized protein n=1 Tax=Gomphillus americanus TaxID=1940652 RepID=A0A8H3I4S9_9LECA|nr:MAG: hypothetical protein GOMPHAMPRED_000181 [Gomphillus americanus]
MSDHYYRHPLARSESVLSRTRSRKRKRNESEDDAESVSSLESIKPQSSQSTWAEFKSSDVLQRKTAGLSAEEAVPGNHFPNRPKDYKVYLSASAAPSQIEKELASLKPPLIDHIQHENQLQLRSSLKQQHITALYTLLHRCILDKDYIRAGRAFGLLLRTESHGQMADLRDGNLWGIGAEILLCRRKQEGIANAYQRGVEEVRQYFEGLIIQFPYRPRSPESLSAVHFYPVLFGLWIASLDDRYKAAIQSVENTGEPGQGYIISQIDELDNIRRNSLVDAQAVISRVDEVMRSIPYSDDPVLWKLKGDMYLWISDLSRSHHDMEEDLSMDSSDREQVTGYTSWMSAQRNAEKAFAIAESHEQTRKSQQMHVYDSDDT